MKLARLTYATAIAAGMAFLTACDEQVTNITEKAEVESVAKFKDLEKCKGDLVGSMAYASDSAKVYVCTTDGWVSMSGSDGKQGEKGDPGEDGTSCTVKALKSGDGYKVICGGDSVGVLLNGEKGKDGKDGKEGSDGSNGNDCKLTDNSNGTVTVKCGKDSTTLYKAMCGSVPYDPTKKTCSNGIVVDIGTITPTTPSYCGTTTYTPGMQGCCGTTTYLIGGPQSCCGTTLYSITTSQCINGTVTPIGTVSPTSGCNSTDLWCKDETPEYRVQTGFNTDENAAGYWYTYTDDADGGNSKVELPEDPDEYGFYAPTVEACGGFCGTVTLNKGTLDRDPFAGVGFNINTDEEYNAVPSDISNWDGICITYTSSTAARLLLGVDYELEVSLGYDVPLVSLPKATLPVEKCFLWSEFKQAGWGKADKISGSDAVKRLMSIKFEIQGKDGSTAEFNVIRLRKYSLVPQTIPSPDGYGNLWSGIDGVNSVVTSDTTEGRWWFRTDRDLGGTSSFDWHANIKAHDESALNPLIESEEALTGTVTMGDGYDYPYAEVGFYIQYGDTTTDFNIEEWGGLCLVYQSTISFALMLVPNDEEIFTEYNNYKASLAKSSTVKTVDLPWSKFKQESGWGRTVPQSTALATVNAIFLRFSGTSGTSGDFAIYAIGKYGTCY